MSRRRALGACPLAVLILAFAGAGQAHAAAGDLDPTFSGDGIQTTSFFGGYNQIHGVAVQGDGKTVAVGEVSFGNAPYPEFAVARYDTDGSLDTTFSDDGIQTTYLGVFGAAARAVVIQPDGKIVAVGETDPGHGGKEFAVVRYNHDGSLDTTFSGDGVQTTAVGPSDGSVHTNAVALAPGGKIVVAGQSAFAEGGFAVVRYNGDGSPDNSFSDDGIQITGSPFASAHAVVAQSDGRIVAGGEARVGGSNRFALVRYEEDGSLDLSFSGDGAQVTDVATGNDSVRSLALQPDGKIVAVGWAATPGPFFPGRIPTEDNDFGVVRYDPDGSLDGTFSGDGIRVDDLGGNDYAAAAAIQPDGKIIAAGYTTRPGAVQLALTRYDSAGALDDSFSGDGKVTSGAEGFGEAMALQPDAKVIVGGLTRSNEFLLARYKTEANAPGAQLTAYPGSIEFPARDVGAGVSPALQTTVTNSGTGAVTIHGVSIGGPDAGDVELLRAQGTDCGDGTVLGVDETCRIRARFDPSATGPRTASVTIASDAPDVPVLLTGEGVSTELVAGPTTLGFGNRDVGEGPTGESTSTVTNSGTEPVTLTNVSVGGPDAGLFERLAGQAPDCDTDTALDAGDTCDVRVRFDPGSTGAKSATVTVASDAPDVSVALSGAGTQPAAPEPRPRPQPTPVPPVTCAGRHATIIASAPGKVTGTEGADVIVGSPGRDRIDGAGGDDVICAGAGGDVVSGGDGRDRLFGQEGNDRLLGRAGKDRLSGGGGYDREHGGTGDDHVSGNAGNDSVSGNNGDDVVTGGSGRDRIYGREGDDRLIGADESRDKLNGGTGEDHAMGDSLDVIRNCEEP